jgi:hypothetical protein
MSYSLGIGHIPSLSGRNFRYFVFRLQKDVAKRPCLVKSGTIVAGPLSFAGIASAALDVEFA